MHGKEVVAFVTSGLASHGAGRILAGRLTGRELRVKGSVAISRIELKNFPLLNRIVGMVQKPYSGNIRVDYVSLIPSFSLFLSSNIVLMHGRNHHEPAGSYSLPCTTDSS